MGSLTDVTCGAVALDDISNSKERRTIIAMANGLFLSPSPSFQGIDRLTVHFRHGICVGQRGFTGINQEATSLALYVGSKLPSLLKYHKLILRCGSRNNGGCTVPMTCWFPKHPYKIHYMCCLHVYAGDSITRSCAIDQN